MLLVYLSLEGEKPRRYLADLFWANNTNKKQRLNNLSRVLSDLRKHAPGTFGATQTHVRARVESDALEFRRALERGDYTVVSHLFRGPFLEGHLSGWSAELEEWIDEQRRVTCQQMQGVYLALAEQRGAQRRFRDAAALACQAYDLDALEPDLLARFYTLLVAAEHPLAATVQREAKDYDLELSLSKEAAQLQLSPTFVGRERERVRLQGLESGAWAWLRGAEGMGKTSLLKSLPGTFLPARSGAPFATLEPILGADIQPGRALQELRRHEGTWLLDDWERVDADSRELLARLHHTRPSLRVVIAGRAFPPFAVDAVVELEPLFPETLAAYPGAWEKTGGVPTLVRAYLQHEPLERVLATYLATFSEEVSEVFFSLTLLAAPCPALVRRALGYSAETMTGAFDTLIASGLITPLGEVSVQSTALALLATRPSRRRALSLELARCAELPEAFTLYQQTRGFWDSADQPAIRQVYLAYANSLQREGHAEQAEAVRSEAPQENLPRVALPTTSEQSAESTPEDAQPHPIERRFPRWWAGVHGVGFVSIALFQSRGTVDAVTTGGIVLTTLLVLVALLYLGWRLVRLEALSVRWLGVGVAAAVGGALALATLSRSGQLESLVCLGSVATVFGTGATIGAVRGWVAGLIGSSIASFGALFAAVQLFWGMDIGLLSELEMTPLAMQAVLGTGAVFWGYILALFILSSLKSKSAFIVR